MADQRRLAHLFWIKFWHYESKFHIISPLLSRLFSWIYSSLRFLQSIGSASSRNDCIEGSDRSRVFRSDALLPREVSLAMTGQASSSAMARRNFLGSMGTGPGSGQKCVASGAAVDFSLHSIVKFKNNQLMHTGIGDNIQKKRLRPNYNGRKRRFLAALPVERREYRGLVFWAVHSESKESMGDCDVILWGKRRMARALCGFNPWFLPRGAVAQMMVKPIASRSSNA